MCPTAGAGSGPVPRCCSPIYGPCVTAAALHPQETSGQVLGVRHPVSRRRHAALEERQPALYRIDAIKDAIEKDGQGDHDKEQFGRVPRFPSLGRYVVDHLVMRQERRSGRLRQRSGLFGAPALLGEFFG